MFPSENGDKRRKRSSTVCALKVTTSGVTVVVVLSGVADCSGDSVVEIKLRQ